MQLFEHHQLVAIASGDRIYSLNMCASVYSLITTLQLCYNSTNYAVATWAPITPVRSSEVHFILAFSCFISVRIMTTRVAEVGYTWVTVWSKECWLDLKKTKQIGLPEWVTMSNLTLIKLLGMKLQQLWFHQLSSSLALEFGNFSIIACFHSNTLPRPLAVIVKSIANVLPNCPKFTVYVLWHSLFRTKFKG